ncbi:MAG: poly-beta-1,6-N-acetyl-D-glucosamine N-deacetylase PgaB [Propionivibrio sp.]|uniref:Poly-beta-1,6-N-acetyl-D-glucosamine N-deacetylase PgaB n=1 Tax=Candidatus Propionivibrio dominans TaxID=2954373 RepID=A0A9D7FFM2_9RHOO|nr:poly-beta-1,6-N-acetyl-D-glucosamine N-deacetylase PgaB [Candidatus Propionivibrio dominans]
MAILNYFRRALLASLLVFLPLAAAQAEGDFIVLCYHEVESEKTGSLTRTAVRSGDLAAQFAWLQASGYHPVSLQQILDSRQGGPALPDKALLLTFDDGKRDVYTRVFPLLKLFRFPVVVALTGHWMNVPDDGMVDYDGVPILRSEFVSWAEVREMQRSGLVEIASHSYDLHRGVLANPQGNTQPAATTRMYAEGIYETDADYLARLRADLRRSSELIEKHTGVPPRTIVWPYGRSNRAAQELAVELGMPVGMTLEDGINTARTPLPQIKRYLIEESPSLQSFAEAVRHLWSPDPARSVRIVPAQWPLVEEGLSRTLDELQKLSPNVAFVDPRVTRNGQQAVLFPTTRLPVAADELNHIAWQIERRAGSPVFIDLPADWLGDHGLLADLARYVNFAGVRIPLEPGDELAVRALNVMERWRWPLRVAYAPRDAVAADTWRKPRPGDLLVLPATAANLALVPAGEAGRVLFEFDPSAQPAAEIARAMRRLEADGFRQFGLAGFPDAGFDPVWSNLSLRSQPLLP